MASSITALLAVLPDKTIKDIAGLMEEDPAFSFESISNQRIVFTALRILSRIFFHFSEPVIIRGEIELTHRCNFNCRYCKTRLLVSYDEETLDRQDVVSLIRKYSLAGCKYMHFNGGEISVLDYVPDLVSEAVSCRMKVGVSSNGSGPILFYQKLVDAGVSYVHISFDVADRLEFERLSSCPGSWDQVTSTLSFLCKNAKTINPDLFVVANLVLREETLRRLPQTLQYLVDLGIDDIKLLPAFRKDTNLAELEHFFNTLIKPEIDKSLAQAPGFDMLKMRLNRLFPSGIHGLEEGSKQKRSLSACEICTEQVMVRRDGTYAPCYIYMRENYNASTYGMGTVKESLDSYCKKASKSLRNKYSSDQTCVAHCPDMIYSANYKAQELVVNCIKALIEAYDCDKGLRIGEFEISYKDLEAPFSKPGTEPLCYHVLAIPCIYGDDLEDILSVISCNGLILEPVSSFDFRHEDFNMEDRIRAKIVGCFLSQFEDGYALYKTRSLSESEIEDIKRRVDEVVQLRVIRTRLYFGQVEIATAQIPVPPILFQDWT